MGSFPGPHYSFPSLPLSHPPLLFSYPPLRLPCHGSGEKWPLRAGIPGLVAIFHHFRCLPGGAGGAGQRLELGDWPAAIGGEAEVRVVAGVGKGRSRSWARGGRSKAEIEWAATGERSGTWLTEWLTEGLQEGQQPATSIWIKRTPTGCLSWWGPLFCGASCRNRTGDLFITSESLYRFLSVQKSP